MNKTWYAVVNTLENTFFSQRYEYGTDCKGKLRHVDFHYNGVDYAVTFRAGYALEALAQAEAKQCGGECLTVTGEPFRTADVIDCLRSNAKG